MNSLILKACLLILAAGVVFSEESTLLKTIAKTKIMPKHIGGDHAKMMSISSVTTKATADLVHQVTRMESKLNLILERVIRRKQYIASQLDSFEKGVDRILEILVPPPETGELVEEDITYEEMPLSGDLERKRRHSMTYGHAITKRSTDHFGGPERPSSSMNKRRLHDIVRIVNRIAASNVSGSSKLKGRQHGFVRQHATATTSLSVNATAAPTVTSNTTESVSTTESNVVYSTTEADTKRNSTDKVEKSDVYSVVYSRPSLRRLRRTLIIKKHKPDIVEEIPLDENGDVVIDQIPISYKSHHNYANEDHTVGNSTEHGVSEQSETTPNSSTTEEVPSDDGSEEDEGNVNIEVKTDNDENDDDTN